MSTFLKSCLCRGRGPSGIVSTHHVGRPDLIAAMLRERNVARFIVASPGFGRSSLAYEYADIVFSFQHVFWVKGTSPCFLRDLDAETFVDGMFAVDRDMGLVVWDDVPSLSAERAALFAAVVDELLDRGVESVVVCTPSADRYGPLERDRLLLGARELLLTDEEMRAECEAGRLGKRWEASCTDGQRIPCIRWCDHDAATLLVRGLQTEELPNDAWLVMMVLLLFERGMLDDLLSFLPAERLDEAAQRIAADYPLFGVDERTGLFRTLAVDVPTVLDGFGRRLDALAAASLHDGRIALCEHVADALLQRGQAERACAFAFSCSTKKTGGAWLARQGWRLLEAAQAHPFCEFHRQMTRTCAGVADRLSAQRAWAAFMLDDEASALAHAQRVMVSRTAEGCEQLAVQVLATRIGSNDGRSQAADELRRTLEERSLDQATRDPREHDFADWVLLGRVAVALQEGTARALAVWLRDLDEHQRSTFRSGMPVEGPEPSPERRRARRSALLLAAAWLIDEHESDPGTLDDLLVEESLGFDEVASFVRSCLEEEVRCQRLSWHVLCAASTLERVGSLNARMAAYLPEAAESTALHRAEVAFFEQQEAQRRSVAQELAHRRRRETFQAQTLQQDIQVPRQRTSPAMRVRVFGGFEVHLGDRIIDNRALGRSKTRMLFHLLVLNRGREMSRDRLMDILWPESEPKRARKNFYSAWSQLRNVFSVEGECPYLVRTRNGCRLDRQLVTSDVADFDKLCRALLFESPETEDWERIYLLVANEYGEDLLSCEATNGVIGEMRESFRTQLVDGIVAAASRLARAGEARGALWFAREAMRRDPRREDVYIALMEAQILSDQRGEALDTYFLCRRFLSESLGIDPSLHLVQLYRSVIESEEVLL